MNIHDFSAQESQLRKTAGRWISGCLLAAVVLWLLGASRFAVFSLVFAFSFAVLGWGPSEQRIPPDAPNKPRRIAAPVSAATVFFGLVVQTLVLLPYPQYMILSAVLPVGFALTWLLARRWPRFYPPSP
ncbi:MAG: hypothetical protein QOD57_5778 [Actinomycetota bacterium]|jgi:hypothetical protein|nr:hypothetical protein [Actinomycetota bacterium]MDQ1500887.1 hypothetical protein [Actinomycetota bacterium]MDQ1508051.1 hypothetical protein [Actinomycetota bacterium]MDQ1566217.1 hypothetical protein [Actinomycetota bacterium]